MDMAMRRMMFQLSRGVHFRAVCAGGWAVYQWQKRHGFGSHYMPKDIDLFVEYTSPEGPRELSLILDTYVNNLDKSLHIDTSAVPINTDVYGPLYVHENEPPESTDIRAYLWCVLSHLNRVSDKDVINHVAQLYAARDPLVVAPRPEIVKCLYFDINLSKMWLNVLVLRPRPKPRTALEFVESFDLAHCAVIASVDAEDDMEWTFTCDDLTRTCLETQTLVVRLDKVVQTKSRFTRVADRMIKYVKRGFQLSS